MRDKADEYSLFEIAQNTEGSKGSRHKLYSIVYQINPISI